jgi:hypothetical protein
VADSVSNKGGKVADALHEKSGKSGSGSSGSLGSSRS